MKALPQMDAEERRYKHAELTEQIIGVFYDVCNELGIGFLEKVYQEAMALVLSSKGVEIEVGLLLNFGPRPQVRRFAFENERKGISVHLRSSAAKGLS